MAGASLDDLSFWGSDQEDDQEDSVLQDEKRNIAEEAKKPKSEEDADEFLIGTRITLFIDREQLSAGFGEIAKLLYQLLKSPSNPSVDRKTKGISRIKKNLHFTVTLTLTLTGNFSVRHHISIIDSIYSMVSTVNPMDHYVTSYVIPEP